MLRDIERKIGKVAVSIPIKDTETIKHIKDLYAAKNDTCCLLLFNLSINTGTMLNDLLSLNIKDVKNKQYLTTDGRKSVMLNTEIIELIKEASKGRNDDEPLFINAKGKRIDRSTVFLRFRSICDELALGDNISVASWRKTFGYHHYMKYKDLSYLQWYFSQTGVEATMQYIGIEENMNLRNKEGVQL